MSKISFDIQGEFPAPSITVELDIQNFNLYRPAEAGADEFALETRLAQEVRHLLSRRLSAITAQHRHEVKVKQQQDEAAILRQMEITTLEDRLADLKCEKTVAVFQDGAAAVPSEARTGSQSPAPSRPLAVSEAIASVLRHQE